MLGRALLPHLAGHELTGITRSEAKLSLLSDLGVEGVVCDVYDREELARVVREARPEVVLNLLTDLADGIGPQNNRIRLEGASNLVAAAQEAGARRLVVESFSFPSDGASAEAVEALERGALESGLEGVVLRFGLFWGPGTWHDEPPDETAIHVDEAGRRAAELVVGAPAGVYELTGAA